MPEMPTQIIDGFKLNATTPIDSRMVTSGTVSRNNLAYKYDGLRVFDTVQKIPFVYIDGKWVQELEQSSQASGGGGTITAAGKKNYFAKFDTNGLTNSVVREASGGANTFVGINIPINSPIETQLHVGGVVKASSFCGNILGTFVNVGTLPLNRLCAPAVAGNYMLKYQNGAAVWGTMDSTATATTIENNTTNTSTFITFTSGTTGAQTLNVSCCNTNTAMSANLATSQLLMSNTNGISTPPYSFIGTSNTGLYGNTAEVGISMAGNKRISATSNKLEISTGGSVNIDAGTNYVQVCKNSTFTGTVNISGVTTITNKLVTNSFQIPTTNGTGKLLTSDATGNATWVEVPVLVPNGIIVMWSSNDIPNGWKPCDGTGKIYLTAIGKYVLIPDMRDRFVVGDDQVGNCLTAQYGLCYGTTSPTTPLAACLARPNIPAHAHLIIGHTEAKNANDTQNKGWGKLAWCAPFTGNALDAHTHKICGQCEQCDTGGSIAKGAGGGKGFVGDMDGASAGTPSGTVKLTLDGSTHCTTLYNESTCQARFDANTININAGGLQPLTMPLHKHIVLIFIIKYNPSATADQDGFYTT